MSRYLRYVPSDLRRKRLFFVPAPFSTTGAVRAVRAVVRRLRPRLVSTVRAARRRRHRRRELVPEPARVREPQDRPKRDQLQFLAQTVRRAVEVGREPARELDVGADQRAERDGGPERRSPPPGRARRRRAPARLRRRTSPPTRGSTPGTCRLLGAPARTCPRACTPAARRRARATPRAPRRSGRSNASTLASISRNVRSNTASASSANGDDGTPGTPREAARNGSSNADAGSSPRRGAARGTIMPPHVDGPRRGLAPTSPQGARDPTSRHAGLARGTHDPGGRGNTVATYIVRCFSLSNRRAACIWRTRRRVGAKRA